LVFSTVSWRTHRPEGSNASWRIPDVAISTRWVTSRVAGSMIRRSPLVVPA
jgi:hypothetical protein